MKKPKLKLSDLKLESFITSIEKIKGGDFSAVTASTGSAPPTQTHILVCTVNAETFTTTVNPNDTTQNTVNTCQHTDVC